MTPAGEAGTHEMVDSAPRRRRLSTTQLWEVATMGVLAVAALVAAGVVLISGYDLFERIEIPLFLGLTVVICADRIARTIHAARNGHR